MSDFVIPADHPAHPANRASLSASAIDQLCQATVDQLKVRLPGAVIVDFFPDRPSEYDFEGYQAAALVIYDGSRFSNDGLRGAQGVAETVRLTVVLLSRSLRGASGAYDTLAAIRSALQGVSLAGSTGLRPLEAELEREQEGVFQYRVSFEGSLIAVPTKSAGVALPRGFSTERR